MRRSVLLAGLVGLALACEVQGRISLAEAALWNTHTYGFQQKGTPGGKVVKLGSGAAAVNAYVAVPPGGKPEAAVIMFSDIFGWKGNNTRLWADRLAKAGFLAVLPDFFRGDELKGNDFMAFLSKQPPARVLKDFTTVVDAVKKAYPSVKKIGQQGFCWGGYYTALLSTGKAPKVDAAAAFHPSLLKPADIDAITGPVYFFASDPTLDSQVNATLLAYIDKSFNAKRAKGVQAYVTSFKGMPHGYALRGDSADAATAKAAASAFDGGVKFLREQLLPAPTPAISSQITSQIAPQITPPGPQQVSDFFGSSQAAHALSQAKGAGATPAHAAPAHKP